MDYEFVEKVVDFGVNSVWEVLVLWIFFVEIVIVGDILVRVVEREVLGVIVVFVEIELLEKVVDFWVKIVWGVFVFWVVCVEMSLFGEVVDGLFIVEV